MRQRVYLLRTCKAAQCERGQNSIFRSVVQLLVIMLDFISFWLFAAGFVHLVSRRVICMCYA